MWMRAREGEIPSTGLWKCPGGREVWEVSPSQGERCCNEATQVCLHGSRAGVVPSREVLWGPKLKSVEQRGLPFYLPRGMR